MAERISTFLLFEGKAEEAMTFYMSLIKDSKVESMEKYGPGEDGPAGSVKHAVFAMAGQKFMCIDSPIKHEFTFTPAISLFIDCESEQELDRLYKALSEGGEALMPLGEYGFSQKFGWVADRFGVSWQLNLPNPS